MRDARAVRLPGVPFAPPTGEDLRRVAPRSKATTLRVAAPDRPGLLQQIAASLEALSLSIVGARITTVDGAVATEESAALDTFAGALLTRSAVQPDLASWLRPWVDAPPEAPPRTAEAEDAAAPVAAPMAADEEWCSIM